MDDIEEVVQYYVAKLAGPEGENAGCSLCELGPAALPSVIGAFDAAADPDIRHSLVRIVGEYRSPSAGPFLADRLLDDRPEIWKTALDGLVTLGGKEALNLLAAARAQVDPERAAWLDEAMQQIADAERELLG
jgi:hypothetical protein